jgi:outer membrane protein
MKNPLCSRSSFAFHQARIFKVSTLFIFMSLFGISIAYGQANSKFGHINSQLLFTSMPESDSAQKKIEREAASMQKTLEELQVEFNRKYEEYLKIANDGTTSELIIRTKEEELQTMQQRIQTFQQQAEQTIGNRRTELFKPIQEKAIKAVNDVAAEQNFTYIFDTASGALVYTSPDAQDILPLVKAKLGLK